LVSIFAALMMFSVLSVQAATQGIEGPTTTGTIENIVTVGCVIWMRSLRDFNFGIWTIGDGTLSDNDNFLHCSCT
jgi:hypothetical protein